MMITNSNIELREEGYMSTKNCSDKQNVKFLH